MRKTDCNSVQIRSSVREKIPGFRFLADWPAKWIFILFYLAGAWYVWKHRFDFLPSTESLVWELPLTRFLITHLFSSYLIVCGYFLAFRLIIPFGWLSTQDRLRSAGLINHVDMVPSLCVRKRNRKNPKILIWVFFTRGIPLNVWEDKQAAIEAALNISIYKMKYGHSKATLHIYSVPARSDLPNFIQWNPKYISTQPSVLTLGEGLIGPITIDLAKTPHILLGGATGSGKSVLLKLLIMQALQKNANVFISDFKGGVDYPSQWHRCCNMCFDESETMKTLELLVDELETRKKLFVSAGVPNIDDYCTVTGHTISRYIFACDEVAEMMDKTGLSKGQKETIGVIESKLSIIARQGRAFGIHLILATQRPDANILPGQIKNNISCRICGRADNVLSQIILDSTLASDQIPSDAQGRFLMQDGTLFQAYWFDECKI